MTTPAAIRQSDLKRMATIAKREGVTVWVEVDGRRYGVSPAAPGERKENSVELPDDFAL